MSLLKSSKYQITDGEDIVKCLSPKQSKHLTKKNTSCPKKVGFDLNSHLEPGDGQCEGPDMLFEEKIIKIEPVDRCDNPDVTFEEKSIKVEPDEDPLSHDGALKSPENSSHPKIEVESSAEIIEMSGPAYNPLPCTIDQSSLHSYNQEKLKRTSQVKVGRSLKLPDSLLAHLDLSAAPLHADSPHIGGFESSDSTDGVAPHPKMKVEDAAVEVVGPASDPLLCTQNLPNQSALHSSTRKYLRHSDKPSGVWPQADESMGSNDSLDSTCSADPSPSAGKTGKRPGVSYRTMFLEAVNKRMALDSKYDDLKLDFAPTIERMKKAKELELEALPVMEKLFTPNELAVLNMNKNKRVNWTHEEIANAFTLRSLSTRTYSYLRNRKGLPLPGKSGLKRWARTTRLRNGILQNVVNFMKLVGEDLSTQEKTCVLLIDEMEVSEQIEYDETEDEIVGPFKLMQVVLAQSLVGSWQQPVFLDFDTEVTKTTLLGIIGALYDAGYIVLCCVSDCGDKSCRLWDELGVSMDQPSFLHPFTKETIACMCEAPVLLRSVRDRLVFRGFRFNGIPVNREPIVGLLGMVASDREICPKLTEQHLRLEGGRNNVTLLAAQLLSNSVATAVSLYTPGRSEVIAKSTSNFINVINHWFDLMNVHSVNSDGCASEPASPFKSPYGSQLEDQNKLLKHLSSMMRNAEFHVRDLPFQRGLVMSCNALPILLKTSACYGIKSILTRNLTFDCTKNLFLSMQVDGNKPTPVKAVQRLRAILFEKISCNRNEWDPTPARYFLFTSAFRKASLDPKKILDDSSISGNDLNPLECNIDHVIPTILEEPRMHLSILSMIATVIALNFKGKHRNLSNPHILPCGLSRKSPFVSAVPTDYFLGSIVKMEQLFLNYVKKNEVISVPGITRILNKRMKSCLKLNLPLEVINRFVKLRVSIHIKHHLQYKTDQIRMKRNIKLKFFKALKKIV